MWFRRESWRLEIFFKKRHFWEQLYPRRNQSAGNSEENIKDEPKDSVLG